MTADLRQLFDQHVRAGERANRAQRLARTARTAAVRRKALAEVAEHEAERARIRVQMDAVAAITNAEGATP